MQDSIIVYRNPMEKAFWESMQNGGALVFVSFIVTAIFVTWAICQLDKRHNSNIHMIAIPIGIACAFVVSYFVYGWIGC